MNKELVIIFIKNAQLGQVKTRLAKTIGDEAALDVYSELLKITEKATKHLKAHVRIYFSHAVEKYPWKGFYKTTQQGYNLGKRMQNAFKDGFKDGYERIVLIGSDLPEISEKHISKGLNLLKHNDAVFGPAKDGGYYLIGLRSMHNSIFNNKPWSQPQLLAETLKELQQQNITFSTLDTLNDIDTFEDLASSNFYKNHHQLQEKIKQNHD